MSKHIRQFDGPHQIDLHQYSGSDDKGLCIQITGFNCDRLIGYVGMTCREAWRVAGALRRWARRQGGLTNGK